MCAGHYERPPYNANELRSVYHIREYDVHKLMQIQKPLDIFLTHDWPRGIVKFGDKKGLLRHKPFLEEEVCFYVFYIYSRGIGVCVWCIGCMHILRLRQGHMTGDSQSDRSFISLFRS